MPAHFARQKRAVLLDGGFDEAVAGFAHHRFAAVPLNPRRQQAGRFHVVNHFRAGVAPEHILRKQHQLAVGIDDAAAAGNHAEAVAVAVESKADFSRSGLHSTDEVLQIGGLGGIGMVVGEMAVHFAKQLFHFATQRTIQPPGKRPGHAVAGIDGDFQRPLQADMAGNVLNIFVCHFQTAHAALRAT